MIVTVILIGLALAVIDQFTGRRMAKAGMGQLFSVLVCVGIVVVVASNVGIGFVGYCILGFVGFCVLVPVCMALYIGATRKKSGDWVDEYIKSQRRGRE